MTPGRDLWGIRELQAKRAATLATMGFTDRQARFLLAVLQHSGVFVERQYCAFAGIVHGQKTHDFIEKLVSQRFAREIRPGALHRGRMYHSITSGSMKPSVSETTGIENVRRWGGWSSG